MKVLKADHVQVERGDMVCLYTGFADVLLEMKKKPDAKLVNESCSGLNGRDEKLLQWITDSGLACLLADNYAVELIQGSLTDPLPRKQPWLPLHEHCLFKNGIHLGEMFYFTELARWLRAHKRNRFLFTAPPLRLPARWARPRRRSPPYEKRVAIVTGGTSGMGEATVRELTKRGWHVAPMARSKSEFQGDVSEDADCRRVAKAVLDKWGASTRW